MVINAKSWVFVGVVSLLLGGCSGTSDGGNSGGAGGTGGNGMGGTGGNGTGGMGTAGNGMGGQGMGGQGTGGTAGAGGGSGVACGGFAGTMCAETEYCDYPNDICGAADGQGACRTRPQVCPDIYMPTCACDGKVYGNECEAASAGFDVSTMSACPPPMPGQFNCGSSFCDSKTQYCMRTNADVPNTPDSFTCVALPMACGGIKPSCACIGDPCGAPIPGSCAATGDGYTVTCPGG